MYRKLFFPAISVLIRPKYTKINVINYANSVCTLKPVHVNMSTASKQLATFEEVKAANNKDVLVVDVREPSELKETGVIPGSINIPLGELENALKSLSDEDFKTKYGHKKPNINYPLIFSCRSGKRSEKALQLAQTIGYTNTKSFGGGWMEWEEKNK